MLWLFQPISSRRVSKILTLRTPRPPKSPPERSWFCYTQKNLLRSNLGGIYTQKILLRSLLRWYLKSGFGPSPGFGHSKEIVCSSRILDFFIKDVCIAQKNWRRKFARRGGGGCCRWAALAPCLVPENVYLFPPGKACLVPWLVLYQTTCSMWGVSISSVTLE